MTNEEAIKILSAWAKCNYKPTRDTAELAISAIHSRQTPAKLDRSRWEECPDCWLWEGSRRFCPDCGRPLTEEAWAELERRINDGTTD